MFDIIIKKTSIFTLILSLITLLLNPPLIAKAESTDVYFNDSYTLERIQDEVEILNQSFDGENNFNVKINNENIIELYTDEVAQINEEAIKAGGLVYGPWFGGADSVYSMSPSETVKLLAILTSAFIPFLSAQSIAVQAATSISNIIGGTITVKKGEYVKVDRTKRYREVKYSDGSFAYWQTKIGASASKSNTYLGKGETIISGGMW